MPNQVKSALNSLVQVDFTPAEILGSPRAFVGIALQNLAGQKVIVTGLVYSTLFANSADRVNCVLKIFIQRNLTLTQATQLPAAEVNEEMFFNILRDGGFDEMQNVVNFIPGLELDPAYNYGAVMSIFPRAGFAGNLALAFSVLGEQVPAGQQSRIALR